MGAGRPKIHHGKVKCKKPKCKIIITLIGDNKDQKYCSRKCYFSEMRGKRKGGKYQCGF